MKEKGAKEIIKLYESINYKYNESKFKSIACKHWLDENCKKGDKCTYSHSHDKIKYLIVNFQKKVDYVQKVNSADISMM